MATVDLVVDSINSPQTTNSPIPEAILHANALGAAYRFGNRWPVYGPYSAARPDLAIKGWIISATLTWDVPVGEARLYDIESGGGSVSNIGKFMPRAETKWGKPILYTFASGVHDLTQAAANQGYGRSDYYVYSAHPDSKAGKHICGPGACEYPHADATQYTFQTPGNCDTGLFESYVLPGGGPVVGPWRPDYSKFDSHTRDYYAPNTSGSPVLITEAKTLQEHYGELAGKRRHDWLAELSHRLVWLRKRVWFEAHANMSPAGFGTGHQMPTWGMYHRGYRWKELLRATDPKTFNRLFPHDPHGAPLPVK